MLSPPEEHQASRAAHTLPSPSAEGNCLNCIPSNRDAESAAPRVEGHIQQNRPAIMVEGSGQHFLSKAGS